jgi:lipoprotein-releasing system permease protein
MLSISLENDFYGLQIFYPKKLRPGNIDPRKDLKRLNIIPGGVFAIEKQYDEKYVFVPLRFAKELLNYGNKRTSLEIKTSGNIERVQDRLKELLGDQYEVLNNEEQHAAILKAVKIEKLIVFIIFTAILLIASVNIFFSLTMLAIDKKKDIAILFSMGASSSIIRRIFIFEGLIISISGTLLGLFLGWLICYVQLNFGLVSMGMENAVVASYPVKIMISDFMITAVSMFLITILISYRPAIIATKSSLTGML